MDRNELAALIDHTLLDPLATEEQVRRHCGEAREHGFAAVCVAPTYVGVAARLLAGTQLGVCTVIGFPTGAEHPEVKAFAARRAVRDGATELDVVMALGRLRAGEARRVREDLEGVRRAAEGRVVKAILETAALTSEELELACRIAMDARFGFVKTSTGFGPGGATVAVVETLRRLVGDRLEIKASGGIRDAATALALVEAGANRLGTSASLAILAELPA